MIIYGSVPLWPRTSGHVSSPSHVISPSRINSLSHTKPPEIAKNDADFLAYTGCPRLWKTTLCLTIRMAEPAKEVTAINRSYTQGSSVASPTSSRPLRFHPNEELVDYYLKRKVSGRPLLRIDAIAEVDLCKCEPWELPDRFLLHSRDLEWFIGIGLRSVSFIRA
ncbi:hypothetical protein B296_00009325 [Ensete ventricosum]|uniref:NAC domain-containing protein n=1 Tax=Ensete ventricosum TaxID=4639 RepID=A0A427AJ38_ENSVE|nr:hypothetical protein B296_00009325 [Ensete ventricosum]